MKTVKITFRTEEEAQAFLSWQSRIRVDGAQMEEHLFGPLSIPALVALDAAEVNSFVQEVSISCVRCGSGKVVHIGPEPFRSQCEDCAQQLLVALEVRAVPAKLNAG